MFQIRDTPNIHKSSAELFSLKGKTCVVTGGSSGIGLEIVKAYASFGATIAIVYNSTPVDELLDEIRSSYDIEVESFKCDMTKVEQIEELFNKVIARFQKIDVLVANAGIGWPDGMIHKFDTHKELVSKWNAFVTLDLSSIYYCCAFVGKVFEKQGFGSLILTASMSGHVINVPQMQTPYNVAKAGVKQMAKSLAVEWSAFGNGNVRVNSVSPGYVRTKLTDKMDSALLDKWSSLTPLGRLGSPKELSGAYVYLASDASTFTTGTDIIVDGGYSSV